MNLPKYQIVASKTFTEFKFVSVGPHGRIPKAVVFTKIGIDLYNLALGDIDPKTGELNDMSRSNNGDMEIILSTVAECIYRFTSENPEASVLMQGNSDARNRLYRGTFNKFIEDINQDFNLFGLQKEQWKAFDKDVQIKFDAFIIKRKKT